MKDTNSSAGPTKLFEEFPPVTSLEWEEKIREDLKGPDYEKNLMWSTGQGFTVKPYYREEDLKDLGFLDGLPGEYPYVRGNRNEDNEWLIRQNIVVEDISAANAKALDILMKGVDSVGFVLNESHTYSYEDLDRLFKNIFAESIETNFICGKASLDILRIILDLVKHYNRNLDKIRGSVDFDPIGELVQTGGCNPSLDQALDECKKLIETAIHLPHFHVITIHGDLFQHAGATVVQELGLSLAAGVEYLTQLTERQLSVNRIAPRIKFQFGAGAGYFLEIARLRAARLLWAAIVKAYGPSYESVTKMFIQTVTSQWNMTVYDPYVNLLRATTESMSSILAGTDSHTVVPFNTPYGIPDDFSERIARNQQLMLREESYLSKVIDPAAGSYYIENLTWMMAEQAWALFLEVEEKGGFLQAFKDGFVQELVTVSAQAQDMALALKKEILVGTNQYPHLHEKKDKELDEKRLRPSFNKSARAIAEPLISYRGSMAFEQIRYATDRYAMKRKRPKAFMLTFGNLAMQRARAQFAANFFACGGFEVLDNIGFPSIEQGIDEAMKSKAEIVVFCSSDDEYKAIPADAVQTLRKQAIPVIAGHPEDAVEPLKSIGITQFIHIHSNVLESLKDFQRMVGVI